MASIDVFHSDPFTMIELTSAVKRNPFLPTGIGELGLFTDNPIRTRALAVEQRKGQLTLIPTSPRGAPATERTTETMDDATSEIYSAFLVEEEGTDSTFQALLEVFGRNGLPLSLYTDRGSHYFHTAEAAARWIAAS